MKKNDDGQPGGAAFQFDLGGPRRKGSTMSDYEIRFIKSDGTPTLVYAVSYGDSELAISILRGMTDLNYAYAEVWRDMDCLHVERKNGEPQYKRYHVM